MTINILKPKLPDNVYRRRHPLEIVRATLESVRWTTLKRWKLISKANLARNTATQYLAFLVKKDLLDEKDGFYRTTPKGFSFLAVFSELEEMVKS